MRCKVGDLAIVVMADHKENVGRFVTVLRRHEGVADAWWVLYEGTPATTLSGLRKEAWGYDYEYRPIRPQSDDAADLLLAPLPQQDKVPA